MTSQQQRQSSPTVDTSQSTQDTESSQAFGSNQGANESISGSGEPNGAVTAAAENLGDVSSFGALTDAAGSLVEVLVPNPGDQCQLTIAANIPVDQSGTVKVGCTYVAKVEHDDGGAGFKLRADVMLNVIASQQGKIFGYTVEAFAKAGAGGYIEAFGDSGSECFRLLGLALQTSISAASEDVADWIFGESYAEDTLAEMDSDDYVEVGLQVGVSAGMGVSADRGGNEMDGGPKLQSGLNHQEGVVLQNKGGELDISQVGRTTGVITLEAGPFGGELKVEIKAGEGNVFLGGKIEGSGTAQLSLDTIVGWLDNPAAALGPYIVVPVASGISSIAGMFSGDAASAISTAANEVSQNVAGANLTANAGRFLDEATSSGISLEDSSIAAKLGVEFEYDQPGHLKGGKIFIEKVSTLQFGASSPNAAGVYIALENVDRLVTIPF